jgi:hypothetical protein
MFGKSKNCWRKLRALRRGRHVIADLAEWHMFIRDNRGVTVWGGISEEDELGIRAAVARAAAFDGPIVEIGALFGWTTQLIASVKSPEKELIAVGNFSCNPFCIPPNDHRLITRRSLLYCLEHCRTRIFDGTSREFYDSYEGPPPSMVFIDGDHSYQGVQADIDWACERDVPVIAGHDYQPVLHEPIVRAVNERFSGDFERFDTVWIADRRAHGAGAVRAA